MPKPDGIRTNNLHVKIREQWQQRLLAEADAVLPLVNGDQRSLEHLFEIMLSKAKGPETFMKVFYFEGPFKEFCQLIVSMYKGSGARDLNTLATEKIGFLEALDNTGNRYYVGNLYTTVGQININKLKLTAEGKTQCGLNGNGSLEIALRNVVGKSFIERLMDVERTEKRMRDGYNKELQMERRESADLLLCSGGMMVENGIAKHKALSVLRNSQKHFYKALVPDFKSATDAALVATGILSVDDAMECKKGNEHALSIPKDQLTQMRKKKQKISISKETTRIGHSRMKDMRYQAVILMQEDGVDASNVTAWAEAHKVVGDQCAESEIFVFKDRDGNRKPPAEQCKIYFDKEHDLQIYKLEKFAEEAGALPLLPSSPIAGSPGGEHNADDIPHRDSPRGGRSGITTHMENEDMVFMVTSGDGQFSSVTITTTPTGRPRRYVSTNADYTGDGEGRRGGGRG